MESHMNPLSRRTMMAFTAIGMVAAAFIARAASFGKRCQPAQEAINTNSGSLSDPGPESQDMVALNVGTSAVASQSIPLRDLWVFAV
jgi:hypothetical protein